MFINQFDIISFVGVILTILIFTEVLQQIILILQLGDLNQHLSVCLMTIFQISLKSIKGGGTLVFAILHEFERRDVTLALSDVNIQAIT